MTFVNHLSACMLHPFPCLVYLGCKLQSGVYLLWCLSRDKHNGALHHRAFVFNLSFKCSGMLFLPSSFLNSWVPKTEHKERINFIFLQEHRDSLRKSPKGMQICWCTPKGFAHIPLTTGALPVCFVVIYGVECRKQLFFCKMFRDSVL